MTSQMEAWLSGGDMRSDGASDAVAEFVAQQPEALPDLVAALRSGDPVVRGRAADALEKVARTRALSVSAYVDPILAAASDPLPMVRWHVAMTLGHLCELPHLRARARRQLLGLLRDESPFVAGWAIAGLTALAVIEPDSAGAIVAQIDGLKLSASTALRRRAEKAVAALTEPGGKVPSTWVKSKAVRALLSIAG